MYAVVREAMNASGLTNGEFAERTGLHLTHISLVRWGHRSVSEPMARRILDACGYRLVITAEPVKAAVSHG